MNNLPTVVVRVEQSIVDDLKLLHGIDAIQEITAAIKQQGVQAEITLTNDGDKNED
jgi:hypothetical protein